MGFFSQLLLELFGLAALALAVWYCAGLLPTERREVRARKLLRQTEQLRDLGRLSEALEMVDTALGSKTTADRAELRMTGADVCSRLGEYSRAIEMLRPIVDRTEAADPRHRTRACISTGAYEFCHGRTEPAVAILEGALSELAKVGAQTDVRSERANALTNLARGLKNARRDEECRSAARQCIELCTAILASGDGFTTREFANYQIGLMHEILDDRARAIEHWRKAVPAGGLPLQSHDIVPATHLASALFEDGRIIESDREAARLVDFLRDREAGWIHLALARQTQAKCARAMGLYQEAEGIFRSTLDSISRGTEPNYRDAAAVANDIALTRIRQSKWRESLAALDEAEQWLARSPGDRGLSAALANNRGIPLRRLGEDARAVECWRRAAEIWREMPNGNDAGEFNLVVWQAKKGDLEALERLFSVAGELKASDRSAPSRLGNLAIALAVNGRDEEARAALDRARRIAFDQAGDADVRPTEYLELWAEELEPIGWREQAEEMRASAAGRRSEVAAAVDEAFPGRRTGTGAA